MAKRTTQGGKKSLEDKARDDYEAQIQRSFTHLSLADLLAVREQYHAFLTQHPNVVATAIGRYLIRDPKLAPETADNPHPPRTLGNSYVDKKNSWPCVLVMVDKWESEDALMTRSPSAIVPKTLYLQDGRAVPVCLVEAKRDLEPSDSENAKQIRFPKSVMSGGCPLVIKAQGREHFATAGCLVSDGGTYFVLTNRHVCGEPGRPIFARLGNELVRIGVSAGRDRQLSKLPFSEIYPNWPGAHLSVNADIGLIRIDDVNGWKTEVFRQGPLGPLYDLSGNNLSLAVIGDKVHGFGAGSGKIDGLISALFYRYRSLGGMEYVADYLIGPSRGRDAVVRRGDSGAVLLIDTPTGNRPFAVNWGAHEFVDGGRRESLGFALATGLGNVCRLLDVDLVRGWNVDQPYTWGKTGHFKIGFRAADLVSDEKLARLLSANQDALGYSDKALTDDEVVDGKFTHDFVPLADVADIIWRTTRPNDEPNHFSDIDEKDSRVFGGKSLLELSLEDDANIDVGVWLDFDQQMDRIDPKFGTDHKTGETKPRPREGGLPFRVWQMYKQMIASLSDGKLDEFLVAGGTMAHYVGDACQPLHISYLHHGHPDADPSEYNVHGDYETKLIDHKMKELFDGVDAIERKVDPAELIGPEGKEAAKLVLRLMKATVDLLPPDEVVEVWKDSAGRGKYDKMWTALGDRTIQNIAAGAHAMAVIWQSAWTNGGGDAIPGHRLVEIDQDVLKAIYNKKAFVPSFRLSDTAGYRSVL